MTQTPAIGRRPEEQHQVVVVGTGCARSAAAMLLDRQGHEVLVSDRANFPSDIIPMVLEQAHAHVHGEGSGGCPLSAMLSEPHNEGIDIKETPPSSPGLALAGSFLEALAAGDFDRLAAVFDDDASVSALLPGGYRVWNGAAEIAAVFEGWFGDVEDYELIDASVGQVGARLQLRWQLRLRGARLGSRARVVEQYAYADTASSGRIHRMALLCSGFCREHLNA